VPLPSTCIDGDGDTPGTALLDVASAESTPRESDEHDAPFAEVDEAGTAAREEQAEEDEAVVDGGSSDHSLSLRGDAPFLPPIKTQMELGVVVHRSQPIPSPALMNAATFTAALSTAVRCCRNSEPLPVLPVPTRYCNPGTGCGGLACSVGICLAPALSLAATV
jgi:hypothetical protein